MDPPSPFGTLSALPVELRLQIWHELLCKPVRVLTPLWFLRSRDGLYYAEVPERIPVDVAIFRSSKACGLEAMEVFYSEHTFSFCALPSGRELECKTFHNNLTAAHFIMDFNTWTPLYPTELTARLIKHFKVSISIPYSHVRLQWGYQMSDSSLCMPLMRKMQTSGDIRKTCFVEFLFDCKTKPQKSIQVLGSSLFRGLKTLTAFEKVTINSSGFSRLVTFALHSNKPRPYYLDHDNNMSVKRYIMKRIVEELEPALGSAAVVDEYRRHIIEFRPRTHRPKSEKVTSMLQV